MTRDELAALLRAHHAPALERQVKQAEKQAQRAAEKLKEARRVAGIEEEPAPSAPSAPAPKRERPNNFETMPESEGGDYSATDKALGAGARSALRADLSRALAEG